jgi:3-methylcrotonyl-CoA carboxylase alpha subunit
MIQKLLIANRGEIAVRIIRTAREMGIHTVAVYSDADVNAVFTRLADEAIPIGAPEPSASYLNTEVILGAARQTGADAIHPGYGFLSERAEFSEACRKAGIIFVGPPPEAMRKLGAKIESKQLAVAAGVPITPGFFEIGASDDRLRQAAAEIGYPVMLKASAGGGGRGMRAVASPDDFDSALTLARDEAEKAFGDGAMMVEKLVDRPRHIEVQFLADSHGNVACLFERECSIQRRHQKLFEESPSPVLAAKPELWNPLKEAVTSLAKAAGYVGAGTAEFIYSQDTHDFYFLEVNARLQVEHPVTEAITGLDLVEWQLRVAAGEELALPSEVMEGDRRAMNGHAIEVRIIAEDPGHGFMPSIGKVLAWAQPEGIGVRVDTGFEAGSEVSRYYDSMLAKLIVHADSRPRAIAKLKYALQDFHILGVKTNISYSLDVVGHPEFEEGVFDTGFLGREFADWTPSDQLPDELLDIAQTAGSVQSAAAIGPTPQGAWDSTDNFRLHNYK